MLDGAVSIAKIAFGGSGNLTLVDPTMVGSSLAGFGQGDAIDLQGIAAKSLGYSGGTLTLYGATGQVLDTLSFAGRYTIANFTLHGDGQGGVRVAYAATPAAGTNATTLHRPEHDIAAPGLWHARL